MGQHSKKIILLGNYGVGKTSLVRRYVFSKFSEEYLTTIGVRIDKKIVSVGAEEISMIIWDIAGESSHQKIPNSYKLGAHGVIYVVDLLRPSTYENAAEELSSLKLLLPDSPIVIVANKMDLLTKTELSEITPKLPVDNYILTSAKTGENVENAFTSLATRLLNGLAGI